MVSCWLKRWRFVRHSSVIAGTGTAGFSYKYFLK
jgi:hypothetical protein